MKKQTLPQISERIANLLDAVAAPRRIAILISIGRGEACVCHLEAALGWRQAYISQHLMALRKADVLKDRREGRYVYYSLKDAAILDLILSAAVLSGFSPETISALMNHHPRALCECPKCAPAPSNSPHALKAKTS